MARSLGDGHHLHRVLSRIEHYLDLFLEFCACNADSYLGTRQIGAKYRNSGLESRGKNAVFMCDLRKFAAQEVQKLADGIWPAQFELVDNAADPFVGFLIFLAVGH